MIFFIVFRQNVWIIPRTENWVIYKKSIRNYEIFLIQIRNKNVLFFINSQIQETISSYPYDCKFGQSIGDRNDSEQTFVFNISEHNKTANLTTFLVLSNEFIKDIQQLIGFEINVAHAGKINITVIITFIKEVNFASGY